MKELAGSRPAEHRCRVLRACGASVAALERTGQWDVALRRFTLLRAYSLAASSVGFNAAIRALGCVTPSWLRPLRLELYFEMQQLGLEPDAHAHAAALSELEGGGPLAAERTARVRMALDACAAATASAGSDAQGGLAWRPLRYGKLGRDGEQSTGHAEYEEAPLGDPSRVAECGAGGGRVRWPRP